MRQAIQDKAAIEFAIGFYDALGAGRSVEDAFKFGRNAIREFDLPGHQVPLLKKRDIKDENIPKGNIHTDTDGRTATLASRQK